jgi:hypothetical protein
MVNALSFALVPTPEFLGSYMNINISYRTLKALKTSSVCSRHAMAKSKSKNGIRLLILGTLEIWWKSCWYYITTLPTNPQLRNFPSYRKDHYVELKNDSDEAFVLAAKDIISKAVS